jgi:hypothetical protein
MHFLDRVADILGRGQAMADKNPTNDEDAIFGLHLAAYVAGERSPAGLDIPRCQRGGKRALQSSCRGCNHVVEGGGARLFDGGGIQPVVPGDGSVNSKVDGRWFCRQIGRAYGA